MYGSRSPLTTESRPSANSVHTHAEVLLQWRRGLPEELQWAEHDPCADAVPYSFPLSVTNLDGKPFQYPTTHDMQIASLRSRYYYAKYIVYRPSVYKALHFPQEMNEADAQEVAECLRVSQILFKISTTTAN